MLTMLTDDLMFNLLLLVFIFILMLAASFSWGYSRGSRAIAPPPKAVIIDELPEVFQGAEEAPITGPIQIALLEPSTGPIDIIFPGQEGIGVYEDPEEILTQSAADELMEARHQILLLEEALTEQIELTQRKEKLRARYLRLLRSERAFMKEALIGRHVHFSPYWKKYLNSTLDQFNARYPIIGDWQPTIKLPMPPQNRRYSFAR